MTQEKGESAGDITICYGFEFPGALKSLQREKNPEPYFGFLRGFFAIPFVEVRDEI